MVRGWRRRDKWEERQQDGRKQREGQAGSDCRVWHGCLCHQRAARPSLFDRVCSSSIPLSCPPAHPPACCCPHGLSPRPTRRAFTPRIARQILFLCGARLPCAILGRIWRALHRIQQHRHRYHSAVPLSFYLLLYVSQDAGHTPAVSPTRLSQHARSIETSAY